MSLQARRALVFFCWLVLGCAPPPAAAPPSAPVASAAPVAAPIAAPVAAPVPAAPADRGEGAAPPPGGAMQGARAAEGDATAARGRSIGRPAPDEADKGAMAKGTATLDQGPIPVDASDPQWGSRDAPVTVVEFADFECPFCGKVAQTLTTLRNTYGPSVLRIVWKNNPLPFHPEARPAAEVAMALFVRGGNDAFWKTYDTLFAGQSNLHGATAQAMKQAGLGDIELGVMLAAGQIGAKIEADQALGKAIGVQGTPAFFINGVYLSGAQPIERFTEIIDEQVKKAKGALAAGTPPGSVYARLAREQKTAAPPTPPAPDDLTVWQVPIGKAPVRGKASALVTMVEFADFQCPFCARVEPRLVQLTARYGDKLRLVYRHNALPFHPRAEPAAELAIEARAQKGDAAFWQVHDALFANPTKLEDADLAALASTAGLDVTAAMKAVAGHKHQAIIDADMALADDLGAGGTPHFFINGRTLVGAQSLERFQAVIDEELAKAEAMIKSGTPAAKLYDKLIAGGKMPPPPEKKAGFPAPTRASPSRGPASAKVVVQFLGGFQCPFCKRAVPIIAELEKAFPGQIRVVWRNLPLPMHKDGRPAAEAALEAFRQQGNAGFWAMHDLLFASPGQSGALDRLALDGYAAQLGLDAKAFADALDQHKHQAAVDADVAAANKAGISGTPAFLVNDYYVSGAQPIRKFKKLVKLALAGK